MSSLGNRLVQFATEAFTIARGEADPTALGATDLAKVDAHEITAEEYEEIPELTDEMMARAVPGNGAELARRSRNRPKVEGSE